MILFPPAIQQPAPPMGATPDLVAECDRLSHNAVNPARPWIAGADNTILVYADEKMWWTMQAKGLAAAGGPSYASRGIKTLIVWNGKKAWKKDLTAKDAGVEEFAGAIPAPSLNTEWKGLEQWKVALESYDQAHK